MRKDRKACCKTCGRLTKHRAKCRRRICPECCGVCNTKDHGGQCPDTMSPAEKARRDSELRACGDL